jgi:hypothetical protein
LLLPAVALLYLSAPALARPMDPSLSRLVVEPSCAAPESASPCVPDRSAYRQLVNQWGFALAPSTPHEARTSGLSGFQLSLVGAFTAIDQQSGYWRRGTRGSSAGTSSAGDVEPSAAENQSPDDWLQLYSLELRKGFGFGVEAAGSLGIMPNTSLVAWGAELRVALLEGMRHGAWRYLPDTSLGLALRRATGLAELDLGAAALDARVSEPFAGSGFIITPWLGYQLLRIDADASWLDLTPGRDALAECGYVGANLPGNPAGSEGSGAFDGAPVCSEGSGADFANAGSFGEAEIFRHRVLIGLSYRKELLRLGAELITDLLPPDAAQTDSDVAQSLSCEGAEGECRPSPRQVTLVLQVGAVF